VAAGGRCCLPVMPSHTACLHAAVLSLSCITCSFYCPNATASVASFLCRPADWLPCMLQVVPNPSSDCTNVKTWDPMNVITCGPNGMGVCDKGEGLLQDCARREVVGDAVGTSGSLQVDARLSGLPQGSTWCCV
jgi:hypothetical protein